jgi:SPX domain protein involved in polyphosphate accumulation
MNDPNFQDRLERNYEVDVRPDQVGALWRKLSEFFLGYGLRPINEITAVGTVYFDNRDYDLTRYTILNPARRLLVRLRAYENYGESPKPISAYWVEIKTKGKEDWKKKRLRLDRAELGILLEGKTAPQSIFDNSQNVASREVISALYEEIQELIITMGLKPFFMLTYKRVAFQNDVERVSLDWDLQYRDVGCDVYSYDSWKYPIEEPAGKSQKTILELKYPKLFRPAWIADLEENFQICETGFLKFVEGVGFLFRGPLKAHREAAYFLRLIEAYGGEDRPLP